MQTQTHFLQKIVLLVIHNWKSKLLALMLAVVTWLYIYMVVSSTNPQLVPVQIEGQAPHLIALPSPEKVEITLTGPQRELNRFYLNPTVGKYSIDKLHLKDGQQIDIIYVATTDFFQLPAHVYFAEPPSPPQVAIKLIRSQTRLLEVRPRIVLKSTQNFIITGISSSPGLVLAKGPAKTIESMNIIETLPIYLPQLDKEGRLDVQAQLPTMISGNKIEYKAPPQVLVHIDIKRKE